VFTNKLDKTRTEATLFKHVPAVLVSRHSTGSGALIVNADDWGRDTANTDRILDCYRVGAIWSVSAMVFMQDSERAAQIALELGIDAGLHLNFTSPFSAPGVSSELLVHHERVAAYLRRCRINQAFFHPGLMRSFDYVVAAQLEEYAHLYGAPPTRLDGHHHMHLCANVLFGALMPAGTMVRRNFSFGPKEKGFLNRRYRQFVDERLARRHRLTDFFFSLAPLEPVDRLQNILALSHESTVELETHPGVPEEYRFLTGDEFLRRIRDLPLATHYAGRGHAH
jgi:predicted glycoside hydrolase/deacetylase ChbG (UPF0249 family)